MTVMIVLIGFSLLLAVSFLIAFLRSVKNGQFDDDYTPSVRILLDDITVKTEEKKESNQSIISNHTKNQA
ncbi:MAG: cbb3-type cytochrome oxidase assembly protein CcoS [Bacteroidia bacterium]|nr:cbb3-type cytochrome oxidase assembly protein CcoS [Bacteroidia bacterium]MCZ2248423.1 cbb3-type cytochrome oxidase assembly protein CcoS [Bacteroidia bacterium]